MGLNSQLWGEFTAFGSTAKWHEINLNTLWTSDYHFDCRIFRWRSIQLVPSSSEGKCETELCDEAKTNMKIQNKHKTYWMVWFSWARIGGCNICARHWSTVRCLGKNYCWVTNAKKRPKRSTEKNEKNYFANAFVDMNSIWWFLHL